MTTASHTPGSDPALPNFERKELTAARADLKLMHDLLGGTRVMWEASTEYIRKWADEKTEVYDIRRKCETVFEGLGRTLSAAIGMLFARAPQLTWNRAEEAMTPHWENIDAAGTAGTVFVKQFSEEALSEGIAIILVDHTPAPKQPDGETVTAHAEEKLGLRPTWARYNRGQALSWRTAKINNRQTLTQLVLYECAEVPDGLFGVTLAHRYRVLSLIPTSPGGAWAAQWQLFELVGDPSKTESYVNRGGGFFANRHGDVADRLPVAIAYAGCKTAPLVATIPLLGVAWASLAHWVASTDLRFYRMLCAFPQPVVIGDLAQELGAGGQLVPGKLRVGPMAGVHLKGDGASFEWVELTGTSMDQLEKGREEKLKQMSQLGVSFLATDTRAAETAEAKRLDATAENSTLATAAQGIEDAINLALEIHAWYLGIERQDAPTLAISRDYESTAMDPGTMAVYIQAVANAGLPVRILLEAWQQGGRLPADTDLDALEVEMMANAAAAAAQKDAEEEARLEAARAKGLPAAA